MPLGTLTRGQVARAAGVHVETLRYYERRRLLPKPSRSSSGYRAYTEEAVRLVRFVKRAQELGFTLKEIAELLAFRGNPRASCRDVRQAAERKMDLVRQKIRQLTALEKVLRDLVRACSGRGPVPGCPILEALQETEVR